MGCNISGELLGETIAFHGHNCPGLSIGIRAAEYALRELGKPDDLICVAETDMCGVDGIQFLTGCTFGKGNLIHRDYGKVAFSFFSLELGRAVRLLLRPDAKNREDGEVGDRAEMIDTLMNKDLESIFSLEELPARSPRGARILDSLVCQECKEETMESRTRRFAGQTLCIPCFEKVEQKI